MLPKPDISCATDTSATISFGMSEIELFFQFAHRPVVPVGGNPAGGTGVSEKERLSSFLR